MTEEFKDLLEALSGAPLSDEEKTFMRSQLRTFMDEHPVRVPFSIRILDALSGFGGTMTVVSNPRLQFAAASLALVIIAGTGTAYAAGNSLPGQPLYGMKVNIEEPIQGALAGSAQAQAEWNAQLASRRLGEAEQLAIKNQLTPSAVSAVASGLDQATENFDANVAQLATSSNDVATAANLESSMEATLAANTQVLSEIQNAVPGAAHSIQPLLSRVSTRALAVSNARAQLDVATVNSSIANVKAAAEAQLDAAEGQLSGVNVDVSAASGTATGTSPQTLTAQAAIAAGQANLNEGKYGAAFETLQTAALDAKVQQIHAAISDQLQSSSGVQLLAATSSTSSATSSSSTATTSDQTELDATTSPDGF